MSESGVGSPPTGGTGKASSSGGPTVNGNIDDSKLTPELLFKMNKKIAQLTKVVYGLNTRGEELELQLTQANQSVEGLRDANADLLRRANVYRNKIDSDNNAGGEAQFYKMECENLRRRLDELSYGGTPHVGGVVGMAALREDLEQSRRREKSQQYELDQARHAISNMKSHHDFIMRERDVQLSMETEKATLEWQARLAEMDSRYKAQVRHLTDDFDSLRVERDTERRRTQTGDNTLREQISAVNFDREREGREWQLKVQMKEHELDEEKIKHSQEKRERDQKIRQINEERRKENEKWEEKMRTSAKSLEERLKEFQDRNERQSSNLLEKEAEFESRLQNKVSEWKIQYDAVDDNLQAEILKLKGEIAVLQSNQSIDNESKIHELQTELQQKAADYELLSKNLKMRISVAETEAKNLSIECKNIEKHLKEEKEKNKQHQHRINLQIGALERHLKEESERHKFTQIKYDKLNGKVKGELGSQLTCLKDSENELKEENTKLLTELLEVKGQSEGLERKLREKERVYLELVDKEVKHAEGKLKVRIEKTWLDKLKKTEESASQDLERLRDNHRRNETDLKKDITMLQKGEIEAKRLNEEFKKKVRQLRQSETELQQKLTAAESVQVERNIIRSNSSVNNKEKQKDNDNTALKNKKELSTLEAKYQEQLDKLTSALAQKQEELQKTKSEAEKVFNDREDKFHKEKDELKGTIQKEATEREEKRLREENDKNESDEEEKQKAEDYENELDENKRKYDKVQMELLLLKQQNEEFEDIVREKHRRQMDLELEVGEITKEMEAKQVTLNSVKGELTYAKNETESSRTRIKKLTEELDEFKDKVNSLETELDNSERELKRMEIMQEKLQLTEAKREELQKQLDEIEVERDEEIKIIQDALDEAAQEREELLNTFEKEIEKLNSLNAAREAQMLKDFEDKLKQLEKEHKERLEEKEKQKESSLYKGRRDQEEIRNKIDTMKSQINSEWEDKLRSECSRLKGELDSLHAEEKHLAVESIKVQKEQELQALRKSFDLKGTELNKEISSMKETLSSKNSAYIQEIDEVRTRADRDVWDLRRKLQRLDESTHERQQMMEDKHRDDMERRREEYQDCVKLLESQLSSVDVKGITELRSDLERNHREQMEHISQQHRLSMERLREEMEAEKFHAAEEARVIVTKHHEYVNTTLREQLTEAITANTQYRDEIEAIRFALSRREEVIKLLEDDVASLKTGKGGPRTPQTPTSPSTQVQGSGMYQNVPNESVKNSQDGSEGSEEGKGSGLLGKVFGGGWFSGAKKDNSPGVGSSSGQQSKKPR